MTAGFLFCYLSAVIQGRVIWRGPGIHTRDGGYGFRGSSLRDAPECQASQKTLRIDVDFELEITLDLGTGGEPLPQIFRQIEAAR